LTIDTDSVRKRLVEERSALDEEIEELRAGHRESIESVTGETGVDSHMGDSATETFDREFEMTVEESLEHRRREIDAALERIDTGTYGICASCGRPIAPERLEALPYATKCIECKRQEERP
jgi:DnaK suppressor protein